MSHLSLEQRADLQQALEFKRKQLRSEIRELLLANTASGDGEEALPQMLNGEQTPLLGEMIRALRAVEEAEARICESNYGHCLACGATIPFERLELVPEAKHCIRCELMQNSEKP